jgi:diguanylate cyclase (GGDEF)-like protein
MTTHDRGGTGEEPSTESLLLARIAAIVDTAIDPLILAHPVRDADGRVVDFVIGDMNGPHTRAGGDRYADRMHLPERSVPLFEMYCRVLATGVTESLRRVWITGHPGDAASTSGWADVRASAVGGDLVVSWRNVDADVATEEILRAQAGMLRAQARQDPLTHLPNRRGLAEVLSSVCAAPEPFAVLFVDVDRFKSINDRYGHAAGDAVLLTTSRRLAGVLRGDDVVGRLAGDEFVVVARSLRGPGDLASMAARLLATGDDVHRVAGTDIRVSVSVGGLWVAEGDREAATVLDAADTLMYTAKRHGGGRLCLGTWPAGGA